MFSSYLKKGMPTDPAVASLKVKHDELLKKLEGVRTGIEALQSVCDHVEFEEDTSGHRLETTYICSKCGVETGTR